MWTANALGALARSLIDLRRPRFSGQIACAVLLAGFVPAQAREQGEIIAWGRNVEGQCDVPAPNRDFVAVAGGYHTLGLGADGSIVAWGDNNAGQCDVPAPNTNFVAVASGAYHSFGLKADGSIVAWGDNFYGQCDVPAPNTGFIVIDGAWAHSLGVKSDSSIVAWGKNNMGQCDVPAPNSEFVAVAGGAEHSLGLKSDGSIVAWGRNDEGQCDVPAPNTDFMTIAAGDAHSLGLKSDGSIVTWGRSSSGLGDVPQPNTDFVTFAAGELNSLGLKSDGSIVAWGANTQGQCDVPAPNTVFVAVAAGQAHGLGLTGHPLIESIADLGNDQGRQVRLEWRRCAYDTPGSLVEITSYEAYRRQDGFAAAGASAALPPNAPAAGLRLAGWDYLMTVPAHGDSTYQIVAPTLCDSTAAGGICWSVFFLRAATQDPFTFFDCFPDSGYSLDNLAPSVPTGLQLAITLLTWDPCPDADFDYFTVYGSDTGDMGDAVLIGYTVVPSVDVQPSPFSWYHVTATDHVGNESGDASVENTATGVEPTLLPSRYDLKTPRPNPFSDRTMVVFDIPRAANTALHIYDVTGRLVQTLVDGHVEPGRHTPMWDGRDASGRLTFPGVYFVRLESGDFMATRRLVRVR